MFSRVPQTNRSHLEEREVDLNTHQASWSLTKDLMVALLAHLLWDEKVPVSKRLCFKAGCLYSK